jgi:hypothetical protein
MSGISAKKLADLQETWGEIAPELLGQFSNTERSLRQISEGLAEMGLDPDQDATYQLIAPGLTAKEFHQTQAFISLLALTDSYHRSQTLYSKYSNGYLYSKPANLGDILKFRLPEFEKLNTKAGTIPLATPLMLLELDLIRNAAQDGTFTSEIKKAHNEIAKDDFRVAFGRRQRLEEPNSKSIYRDYKDGLGYAESTINNIDKAQEFYTPGLIPMDQGSGGWGWKKNARTEMFNRAAAETLKNYFIMKVCGTEFVEAKAFQDKGEFVLDSSGSGHGAMTLPMQRILERLQEAQHDIRDPKTYQGMGTDIDTFWDCYRRERDMVLAVGKYNNLVKPQFNR